MNKTEARNQFTRLRSNLSQHDVRTKSQFIANTVKATIDWPSIQRVHIFQSVDAWNEVKTDWVQPYIMSSWPHIDVLVGKPDKYSSLPDGVFDLIFVPLVAFDDHLNRLGFGGGWYDRFLATQNSAVIVGLAYEFQRADRLTVKPHDKPMTCIITESTIYGDAIENE